MKTRYKLAIALLLVLFASFEFLVALGGLASQEWLDEALQGAAVFVALTAGVIALHSSDRRPPQVTARMDLVDGPLEPIEHTRESTREEQWKALGHNKSPFRSGRVHFRIVNTSGFTLQRPTVTFRLPLTRQHPHRLENGSWVLTFNSNLYNSQEDLRTLQFADTAIISNTNLPFWNNRQEIVFWIRMALDAPDEKPFLVEVALNAENAQGYSQSLNVNPDSLLET